MRIRFELFGGNIHGKFVELVPDKKLVLSWRCNQWQDGHFSTVTLDLEEMVSAGCFFYVFVCLMCFDEHPRQTDHTKLKMTQTGVPEREVEATQRNWKLYYWNSIKQTFGFGSYI